MKHMMSHIDTNFACTYLSKECLVHKSLRHQFGQCFFSDVQVIKRTCSIAASACVARRACAEQSSTVSHFVEHIFAITTSSSNNRRRLVPIERSVLGDYKRHLSGVLNARGRFTLSLKSEQHLGSVLAKGMDAHLSDTHTT